MAIVLLLELGSLCAQEQEPSLLLWNRGSYNNHLELGLSLDPNTTAVERADPQLSGWVWAVGGRWRWARPTPLGTVGVGLAPSLERYRGSDPLIGNFNGGTLPVELSWRLSAEWGPPFELRLFGVRRSRRASVYNGWESGMELALGRAVRYRVRRLRFDDARSSRRDYLFIGSLRQELSVEADLFVDGPMAAQLRLSSQREQYDPVRDRLLALAIQQPRGFRRLDWRQRGEAIGFYQLAPALLLSLGVQLRWNDSNAAFYDFWLLELWGGVFWSDSEGRSLLLEIGGGAVQFRGRPITPEGHRRDRSWRLLASAELPLGVGWSVHPRLRWVRNRTNESRTALEFLNFDQTIVELQIEWRWGAAEKSPEGRSLREGLRAFVFPEGEGKGTIQAERREQLRR